MSDAAFSYDVFLSHSAKDKAVVRAVAERLRKDRLKVWFDEWEIKPGSPNQEARSESALTSVRPDQSMSGLTSAATREEKIDVGLEHSQSALYTSVFILHPLLDAPIKGSPVQLLYINWLPAGEAVEAQMDKLPNLKRPPCGGSSGFCELLSVWPEEPMAAKDNGPSPTEPLHDKTADLNWSRTCRETALADALHASTASIYQTDYLLT